MIENRDKILHAAAQLLSVCDGANEEDGVGYNKPDATYVRQVFYNPNISDSEIVEIAERLQKYRRQLEGWEIDIKDLKPIDDGQPYKEKQFSFINPEIRKTWNSIIMPKGKYANHSLGEIVTINAGYIEWLADNYSDSTIRDAAQKILKFEPINLEKINSSKIDPSWEKFKINFGKFKGKSIFEISKIDSGYLSWLADNSFDEKVKSLCKKALDGEKFIEEKSATFVKLDIEDDVIIIKSSKNYKDKIKDQVPERRWNPDHEYWTTPLRNFDIITKIFPEATISDELKTFLEEKEKLKEMARSVVNTKNFDLDNFGHGKQMYPFQKAGLQFLEVSHGRAIIADEMGLGKTIEAMSFLQFLKGERPCLIVSPSSVKGNWNNELKSWLDTNDNIQILKGRESTKITGSIVIINYDILNQWKEALSNHGFKIVIFDEAHRLKNPEAVRTKAAFEIVKNIEYRILLTGTPLLNRPKELYSLLHIVQPELYTNEKFDAFNFFMRYCNAENNGYGWSFNGSSNEDELAEKLKYIMIRRTKDEVGLELPPKTRSAIFVELTNKTKYKDAEKSFYEWLEKNKKPEKRQQNEKIILKIENDIIELKSQLQHAAGEDKLRLESIISRNNRELDKLANETYSFGTEEIAQIELSKQFVVEGKMKCAFEWIDDFIETDQKLVIFTTHQKTINELMKKYGEIAVKIDGSTPEEKRTIATEKFQKDPKTKLFVGNVLAAGEGITLTAASNILFLELPWRPSDLKQSEDRCHRISQNMPVNAYYMLAKDTIEEYILDKIENKRRIITLIMDDHEILDFDLFRQKA